MGKYRGCSSVVEHNLAKVGVEGSNPFTRSKFQDQRSGEQVSSDCFQTTNVLEREFDVPCVGKVADKLLTMLLSNSEVIVY